MERDHRHVDLSCVPSTLQSCDIDWTSCILCQLNTKEPLTCPGVGTSGGQGYSSFAENLKQFILTLVLISQYRFIFAS